MDTLWGTMSPLGSIQYLPDDVFAIIFEMAYRHDFPRCRCFSGLKQQSNSEIVLTHVCRRWRGLALSLPFLWSCHHIVVNQSGVENASLAQVHAYLPRSGQQQLSVTILCYSVDEDDVDTGSTMPSSDLEDGEGGSDPMDLFITRHMQKVYECLGALLQECHRWRDCALYANTKDILRGILEFLHPYSFLHMRFLQLGLRQVDSAPLASSDLALNAPILAHCRAYGSPLPLSSASFQHITELKLDTFNVSHEMLIGCFMHTAGTLSRIILRNIYATTHGARGDRKYRQLQFPNLTYLAIYRVREVGGPTAPTEPDTLVGMILNGSPTLHTFVCVDRDVTRLIKGGHVHLPLVRSLVLHASLYTTLYTRSIQWSFQRLIQAFPLAEDVELDHPNATQCLCDLIDADEPQKLSSYWPSLSSIVVTVTGEPGSAEPQRILMFLDRCTRSGRKIPEVVLRGGPAGFLMLQGMSKALERYPECTVRWQEGSMYDNDPFNSWDVYVDRPAYLPWNESMTFHDQFM